MHGGRGTGRRRPAAKADEGQHRLSRADAGAFRRLLRYVRPHLGRMLIAAFSLLVATLLSLIFPWIIRNLVDSVFVHHDANTLNLITLGLFGVFIGQAAFNFVQNYLIAWIGERIVVDLRRDLYRHLQTLPPDFYADRRTGELLSRITNDVNAVQNTVSNNLLNLMQEVVTLVGSMAIIFYLDWRLSLLLLVVAPLIAFSAALFGRALNRTSRKVQEGLGDATAVLEETIANMRVVQAFTRERYELGRFGDLLEHVFALTLTRIRIRAAFVATDHLPGLRGDYLGALVRRPRGARWAADAWRPDLLPVLHLPHRRPTRLVDQHLRPGAGGHGCRDSHLRGAGCRPHDRRCAGRSRPAAAARTSPLRGGLLRVPARAPGPA